MNLGKMLKQAQEMQTKMADMQAALEARQVTGQSGAGLVQITLDGKGEMRGIKIDPSLLTGEDGEMVEDLIVAAHNDAKTRVQDMVQEEMQKMTGGLGLPPGFKLPF